MAAPCALRENPELCRDLPKFEVSKTIVLVREIEARDKEEAKQFWTDEGAETRMEILEARRIE